MTLLSTTEIKRLTGLPATTLSFWINRGWVKPARQGGYGRGVSVHGRGAVAADGSYLEGSWPDKQGSRVGSASGCKRKWTLCRRRSRCCLPRSASYGNNWPLPRKTPRPRPSPLPPTSSSRRQRTIRPGHVGRGASPVIPSTNAPRFPPSK